MLLFVNPRMSKETRDESWKEEQEEKFGRRRSKAVLKRIFEDIFVACNRRGISFGVLTPDIILLLPRSNEVERARRQCGCRRGWREAMRGTPVEVRIGVPMHAIARG